MREISGESDGTELEDQKSMFTIFGWIGVLLTFLSVLMIPVSLYIRDTLEALFVAILVFLVLSEGILTFFCFRLARRCPGPADLGRHEKGENIAD